MCPTEPSQRSIARQAHRRSTTAAAAPIRHRASGCAGRVASLVGAVLLAVSSASAFGAEASAPTAASDGRTRKAQHRLRADRRRRLQRLRRLWRRDRDAEHRPARQGGGAVHQLPHRLDLRGDSRDAPVGSRQPSRRGGNAEGRDRRQPEGQAGLRGLPERPGPQPRPAHARRRLRHLLRRQVEPRRRPGALTRGARLGPLHRPRADRRRQLRSQGLRAVQHGGQVVGGRAARPAAEGLLLVAPLRRQDDPVRRRRTCRRQALLRDDRLPGGAFAAAGAQGRHREVHGPLRRRLGADPRRALPAPGRHGPGPGRPADASGRRRQGLERLERRPATRVREEDGRLRRDGRQRRPADRSLSRAPEVDRPARQHGVHRDVGQRRRRL